MPGDPKAVSVTVDPAVAKRADEAYSAELDAEVKRRIDQEKHQRMDPAAQAALEAAQKKADAADARASAAETADKAAADAQAKADATETLRRATFLAEHRGMKGDALTAEAARLAAMGRAAVDELLVQTPVPQADPLALQLHGGPAPADAGKQKLLYRTEGKKGDIGVYTLNDPSMTVPPRSGHMMAPVAVVAPGYAGMTGAQGVRQ